MPTASLVFQLPEENREHMEHVHAGDAWAALVEIDRSVRQYFKHSTDVVTPEHVLDLVRKSAADALRLIES